LISRNVEILKGTNINGPCFLTSNTIIGKYCAIGYNLRIRVDSHSMDYPNILGKLQKRYRLQSILTYKNQTIIGHTVWIGDNVTILGNVNIGNGVIIGAGSIVTKDIPDYSVAVGNPAKVIRYRFSDQVISELKDIQWWHWNKEKIKKNIEFLNTDLTSLNTNVWEIIN
jgi:virginiamycin A acetyltransferase